MNQELIPVYEEMEEQIKKISNNKEKKSEPICISGRPIYLPLNGHKIEVTYYKAKKKTHLLYLEFMVVNLLGTTITMTICFGI